MQLKEQFYRFTIIGPVKAKQSVKFAQVGNYMKKYTPKDVTNYANWVKMSFLRQYPEHRADILDGYYLEVTIFVYFKVPESFSQKKKDAALNRIIRPDKKPDWDNISKNICDALNGVAWPDDKAIVIGAVRKEYAQTDHVCVDIRAFKYIEGATK